MSVTWAEVTCEAPTDLVDQLADFLVALSGSGVCIENLEVDTFSVDTIEDSPVKKVKTYFIADDELQNKIDAIVDYLSTNILPRNGFHPTLPRVVYISDEDWSNNWKRHFTTLRVGKRIVIKPTWEAPDLTDESVVIELDPGMAFGTGTHPTSRLCLEAMERILGRDSQCADSQCHISGDVLDVGTGSGILSVAAAKLGAAHVISIDIDPEAVEVAKANAVLNRVQDRIAASDTPLRSVDGLFYLVVANILAEDLVQMSEELVARMEPGGFLVLSGILVEKEPLVLQGFSPLPLELVATTRETEWSCITFRLPASIPGNASSSCGKEGG